MKDEWTRLWARQRGAKPTKRIIEQPTKKILTYWSGLRKATTSVLIQLRTGKIGLNHYLSRIKRRETARCSCNLGAQTPRHVVLICPLLQDLRKAMWERLRDVPGLRLGTLENLLTEKRAAVAVAELMVKSELLGQFHGVDPGALGTAEKDTQESAGSG